MEVEKSDITNKSALEIIASQVESYRAANRAERGKILDNLQTVLRRNRKSLIRSLNRLIHQQMQQESARKHHLLLSRGEDRPRSKPKVSKRGRPHKYTKAVESALVEIWEMYNCICAERLYPQISIGIAILQKDHDWHYSKQTTELLRTMPLGTMKQYLVRIAKDKGLMRGISTTRSSEILNAVPIFHGEWRRMPVGYGQIDTVVHSGPELIGQMVYTVNYVEMQTYWQEFRAQLGKTAGATRDTISQLFRRMPLRATGIHSDTGDEYVNYALVNWCKHKHIDFTRSRPYKKNDNCNIEERNKSIIRKYVGYERYDCQEAMVALNQLYDVLRLYVNYFQPIMKIASKTRYPDGKAYRKYDIAKTPYERVLEHPQVSIEVKAKLAAEYQTLNPKRLLATIKALTINLERVQREQGYHFNSEA